MYRNYVCKKKPLTNQRLEIGVPMGIRTPVTAVKGRNLCLWRYFDVPQVIEFVNYVSVSVRRYLG